MAEQNQKGTFKAYQLIKKVYQLIKKDTGSDSETVLAELSVDVDEKEVLELSQSPDDTKKTIPASGKSQTPVTFISDRFELSNEQISMIMENVPLGILTLNNNLKVNPGYSSKCIEIFNSDSFELTNFLELLGVTEEQDNRFQELTDYLNAILNNEETDKNPFEEFELKSKKDVSENDDDQYLEADSKWLNIKILNTSSENILVIIEDITDLKNSHEEIENMQLKKSQLESIILDTDLYCELTSKMSVISHEIEEKISNISDINAFKDQFDELYKQALTIKSIANSFVRYAIADACSNFIALIEEFINKESLEDDDINVMKDTFSLVQDELRNMTEETKLLLDIDVNNEIEKIIRINAAEIKQQIENIKSYGLDEAKSNEITSNLNTLRKVPVYKGLGLCLKMIPGMIEHLGKEVTLNIEDNDILIDYFIADALNKPVIKLIHNIIKYGIDSPDDRFDRNKPEGANVTISLYYDEDALTIEITDDGEGLSLEDVKVNAVENNVLSQEDADNIPDEEILDLIIFNPDYSSEDPGFGYGFNMHEIANEIRQNLKGEIFIDSVHGQGTTFIIKIPQLEAGLEKTQTKRVYGYYNGRYYLFLFDADGDCVPSKINREDVPEPVIEKWIKNNTISE